MYRLYVEAGAAGAASARPAITSHAGAVAARIAPAQTARPHHALLAPIELIPAPPRVWFRPRSRTSEGRGGKVGGESTGRGAPAQEDGLPRRRSQGSRSRPSPRPRLAT